MSKDILMYVEFVVQFSQCSFDYHKIITVNDILDIIIINPHILVSINIIYSYNNIFFNSSNQSHIFNHNLTNRIRNTYFLSPLRKTLLYVIRNIPVSFTRPNQRPFIPQNFTATYLQNKKSGKSGHECGSNVEK